MTSVKGLVSTFEAAAKPKPVEVQRKQHHVVKETTEKFQKYVNNVLEQREKQSPYRSLVNPAGVPAVFSLTDYRPPRDPLQGSPKMKWTRTANHRVFA